MAGLTWPRVGGPDPSKVDAALAAIEAELKSQAVRPRAAQTESGYAICRAPQSYVATDDLQIAVNAAVTLERPLLVKGEPGTGKTVLAHEVADALGAPLIEWHVKSTTKAQHGLYDYDAVARACVTGNWAMSGCRTSRTTSCAASSGKRLKARRGRCC